MAAVVCRSCVQPAGPLLRAASACGLLSLCVCCPVLRARESAVRLYLSACGVCALCSRAATETRAWIRCPSLVCLCVLDKQLVQSLPLSARSPPACAACSCVCAACVVRAARVRLNESALVLAPSTPCCLPCLALWAEAAGGRGGGVACAAYACVVQMCAPALSAPCSCAQPAPTPSPLLCLLQAPPPLPLCRSSALTSHVCYA